MLCTRFTIASLYIVFLGYQPVTALAQSQDPLFVLMIRICEGGHLKCLLHDLV